MSRLVLMSAVALLVGSAAGDTPKVKSPREALKPFNLLVGSWKGTGTPEGSTEDRQKGHWTETVTWEWQFKGDDAWLKITFDKGKHFREGELRYLPEKDAFRFVVADPRGNKRTFEGKLAGKRLTLDREDDGTKESQRIVFSFIHDNRFLYRYEVKPATRPSYARKFQVGATKEGVAFAGPGDDSPECVVSGGKGTIPVTYQGQTYYVCCTGCRDEFKENPEKYLKEYEARKGKQKK
jgi:YHS domain-containing protein